MSKALMFLGTASESGKSIMAAAFCRILKRRGVSIAPFKSQNMALNSGVTPDGREMGRAQIVQAECAGIEPHVDMNPILLKPTSEKGSQVIVHGVVRGNMDAAGYYREKKALWPAVTESYDRLSRQYDVIVLEGAGSPVEINLKENDIVNMAVAEYAGAGVVLVADIDRGGVFASILGTVELLTEKERGRLIGFIVNKFRGDISLFHEGLDFIEQKTGFPVLGVVPFIHDLYVPGEDSVSLEKKNTFSDCKSAFISVGIIQLPHISNYTDFDPLECDKRFKVEYVKSARDLGVYDVVILPGSKNVFFDYRFLVENNLRDELLRYYESGGRIVGICGGFQMLGESIKDPYGVEGNEKEIDVLGLLPVFSVMDKRKVTERVKRAFAFPGQEENIQVEGYEIHMGQTTILDEVSARFLSPNSCEREQVGAAAGDGKVWGTYMHGLFDNDELRDGFLSWVKGRDYPDNSAQFSYMQFKERNYDMLADAVEKHVNVGYILKQIGIN
jgi:adenosylcobyric acid synthase